MAIYYHLSTSGEDTNLQLYSYREAKRGWDSLYREYEKYGDEADDLKERCVFVLATLGLSISQLLGQNNPDVGERVPYPRNIFFNLVDTHQLDPRLKEKYNRFNYFYNGCRHFGVTLNDSAHNKIDELTFKVASECFEFGLEIWRIVINIYAADPENDLSELFTFDTLSDY
ncbi:MAG: hypothetical protein CMO55_05590 [Verrucomicrobiales bacterium]|nr:hypothetical protein [Verrucomicrobiales bacterium]